MLKKCEDEIFLSSVSLGIEKTFRLEICYRRGMRNLVLRVKGAELIAVSAPYGVSILEIKNFVRSNAEQILKSASTPNKYLGLKEFFEESPFAYLQDGKYSVILKDAKNGDFFIRDEKQKLLLLAFDFSSPENLKSLFFSFAKTELKSLVEKIALAHNFEVPKITIRDQRTCWGSRSSSQTMSFNWRILLIEPIFQEYIICHEFAHIKFMDHSVSFWIYLNRIFEGARRVDRRLSDECKKASNCAL